MLRGLDLFIINVNSLKVPEVSFHVKGPCLQHKTASKPLRKPTLVFYDHCPAAGAKVFKSHSCKVWVHFVHGFGPRSEWFSYWLCFVGATPTLHNMAHVFQRRNLMKRVLQVAWAGQNASDRRHLWLHQRFKTCYILTQVFERARLKAWTHTAGPASSCLSNILFVKQEIFGAAAESEAVSNLRPQRNKMSIKLRMLKWQMWWQSAAVGTQKPRFLLISKKQIRLIIKATSKTTLRSEDVTSTIQMGQFVIRRIEERWIWCHHW